MIRMKRKQWSAALLAAVLIAASVSFAPLARAASPPGVYNFTVIGHGHGVGLSQEGAKVFAARGWNHEQILWHYYNDSKIHFLKDAIRPWRVVHAGKSYELKEYLARVAYGEIGRCGLVPNEAVKAQMVCAYTIAKKRDFKTTETDQHLLSDVHWNSNFAKQFHAEMLALARSVLGKYVAYDGAVADTLYFASCSGATASGKYAWGGNDPAPYLTGGRVSPESASITHVKFTINQIRSMAAAYNAKNPGNKVTLGSDPGQWIKVISKEAHGYVQYIQIGNRIFTGGSARMHFFGPANLRSHNFAVHFAAG